MATDSDLRLWLEMSLVRVTALCQIMQDYKKEALLAGCSVCAVYDQRLCGRQAASSFLCAGGDSQNLDLRVPQGIPAQSSPAPAAASRLRKVGLGAQGGVEYSRLLSDGSANFEGDRGPGFYS